MCASPNAPLAGDTPSHRAPAVTARVDWFDPGKGFGFVLPDDGEGPAFLHISLLNRAGLHAIAPGTEVVCRLAPGERGRQVVDLVHVGEAPAEDAPITGTVKWFKDDKGYGFVLADDGGEDVFVHSSVARRCGIAALSTGRRLAMRVRVTAKGREAVWLGSL
jgi:cold shock protein